MAINYFFNAGVVGSSMLLFMLTFFVVAIIAPIRQSTFWLYFNILIVLGLLFTEYRYPQTIISGYASRLNYIIDVASTYVVGIILIHLAIRFSRKAYEAEKQQVEEKSVILERLNAEKNKLFSIVSHDLRSPLASIQQYLELIRETDLDEELRKQIKSELLDVVNHTQEMLSNLLLWSTSQMNGLTVNRTQVHVASILIPIAEIYKPFAAKKGLQMEVSADPDLNVLADSNMLHLIVRNLLGNALKFTPSGGFVMLKAVASGTDCIISVQDNGTGINPDDQETLFSLKSRVTFGTNNEKGVGLGLFLCKEYAEAQQGKLWFESELNTGTTFYVALPLAA
ncbi:sensor histidine kinase [Larkinella arboricola]|uniref:sensor histidine kinase n=1 Tax=Larkinella arboricola TaxID=643671 RepID=UPI0014746B0B|nr:HAMP domain-containing sensor histidine kinase [Larkinella arboricola]